MEAIFRVLVAAGSWNVRMRLVLKLIMASWEESLLRYFCKTKSVVLSFRVKSCSFKSLTL